MKLLLLTANEFTKIFKRRGLMFFFVLVILNCFLAGLNVYESYTTARRELFAGDRTGQLPKKRHHI